MDLPSLPLRMLLSTDGSVTALLEASFGAPVAVETRSNTVDQQRPRALRRSAVLRARRHGPAAAARVTPSSRSTASPPPPAPRCSIGEEPIGTVLREARLETRRELEPYTVEHRDRRRRGRARRPERLARVRAHLPDRQLLAPSRRRDRARSRRRCSTRWRRDVHADRRAVLGRVARADCSTTAHTVAAAGAAMLRGGAYKPRTSPHSFQGLGRDGLELLAEARARDRPADRDRADRRARDRRRARGRRRDPDRRPQHAELSRC